MLCVHYSLTHKKSGLKVSCQSTFKDMPDLLQFCEKEEACGWRVDDIKLQST